MKNCFDKFFNCCGSSDSNQLEQLADQAMAPVKNSQREDNIAQKVIQDANKALSNRNQKVQVQTNSQLINQNTKQDENVFYSKLKDTGSIQGNNKDYKIDKQLDERLNTLTEKEKLQKLQQQNKQQVIPNGQHLNIGNVNIQVALNDQRIATQNSNSPRKAGSIIERYLEEQKKVDNVLLLDDMRHSESYLKLQQNPAQFFMQSNRLGVDRPPNNGGSVSSVSASDIANQKLASELKDLQQNEKSQQALDQKGAVRPVINDDQPSNIQQVVHHSQHEYQHIWRMNDNEREANNQLGRSINLNGQNSNTSPKQLIQGSYNKQAITDTNQRVNMIKNNLQNNLF
ncbi:UNKNOWN [Stylonychia lemnae]|uniref:Uncharacterized protein n=1 Tax=Stylonychia lemnae TaxID=5949 RepID=A0A078A1C6_STYLE|nr:UNKNOWN [Stylonychia lemnae]|eukprot:CDW76056.1 UNKNOWN [Stylonychia lemnae]